MSGEEIIVPNSIINSSSVVKKKALNFVRFELSLSTDIAKKVLDNREKLEKKIQKDLGAFGQITEDPVIRFTDFKDGNAYGFVTVKFKNKMDAANRVKAKDTIFRNLL